MNEVSLCEFLNAVANDPDMDGALREAVRALLSENTAEVALRKLLAAAVLTREDKPRLVVNLAAYRKAGAL